MKILNLYAGLGGNRRDWNGHEIVAVENNPDIANYYYQAYFIDALVLMDVQEYLLINKDRLNEFDFIWASPPCQTHSCATSKEKRKVPDLTSLYGLKIFLDYQYDGFYCIENVQPFYKAPIKPTFKIGRHLFWANFKISSPGPNHFSLLNGENKHERSIIMRGKLNDLLSFHKIPDRLVEFIPTPKEKYLRNMTHYSVGKYILDQLQSPGLMSYIDA